MSRFLEQEAVCYYGFNFRRFLNELLTKFKDVIKGLMSDFRNRDKIFIGLLKSRSEEF
jgi:hypothetical protein